MDIEAILQPTDSYAPPVGLRTNAKLQDLAGERRRSLDDPEGFWGEWAARFEWGTPWDTVMEWENPDHRWFVGATCNITQNALDRHADGARRNQLALIWVGEQGEEVKLTYGELRDRVSRFATALRGLGVATGDRVIIYMPLTVEGVIAMLATARLGAIHSVVYAGMGVGALRSRIDDAGARVVIAGDVSYRRGKAVHLRSIVEEATAELPLDALIWHQRRDPAELSEREHDFDDLLWSHSPETPPQMVDAEHPLFILYTSGSTGAPKGVVHVHGGYMVGTSYHLRTFYDVRDTDVFWSTSDIGWIVGHSYIVYAPLVEGVTTVMREGAPDYPDPGAIWRVVERYGVNVMFTAPTAVRMWMRYGRDYVTPYTIDTLRLMAVAGEPLNPEAWRWATEELMGGGTRGYVVDNWWQTELGGPTVGTPIARDAKPGAAGVALPGVEASVVDYEGRPIPPGRGGLLVLHRPFPHMMRTIWNNHSRYELYWNELPGNVYSAGDIATHDEEGYFTVLGRSDDVLNVAGHRIGTADVESALISHEAVAESAAIGVPDEIKGEAIKVFVVLRPGHEAGRALEQSLIAHVRRELGPIATPQQIEIVDQLPKTRSGKILRRLLKAQELGEDPGDLSTLEE